VTDGLLDVSGVHKAFGAHEVIAGLDLSVPEGQVTGLVGPNGAGKTTIFNLITGFLHPNRGAITYRGTRLDGLRPEAVYRRGVARTFQELRLFEGMSVFANVLLSRERGARSLRSHRRNKESVMQTLDELHLARKANVLAADLSYAEEKFLSLARALATDAPLLLLDEPTSGLDGPSLDMLMSLIPRLCGDGRTVLIVEHNLDVMRKVADGLVFLDTGRVIASGTAEELFARNDLAELYFGSVA
jgi:ABC-type branched-subunit amino acid transport system ATPase component